MEALEEATRDRSGLRRRAVRRSTWLLALLCVIATAATGSAAYALCCGFTSSGDYDHHLHSSGGQAWLNVVRLYGRNDVYYNGSGYSDPVCANFDFSNNSDIYAQECSGDVGEPVHNQAYICANGSCTAQSSTFFTIGAVEYSGYAHTLDGYWYA
jgi:hypothetical protein